MGTLRRVWVVLGSVALVMLALAGGASAASYPYCTSAPSNASLSPGESVTVTVTCEGDPGDVYTAHVTNAPPGLAGSVTPGAAPNTFAVRLTAPADAQLGSVSVTLSIDGGPQPSPYDIYVQIRRRPLPDCTAQNRVTVPTGGQGNIYVDCELSGYGGDESTLEIVDKPKHGQVTPTSDPLPSGWLYKPDAGFTGRDRFTFRARNSYGLAAVQGVDVTVRKATRYERDAEYLSRVCSKVPPQTSCRAGRGRRTIGGMGTGKVSHRHWPKITGVYFTFPGRGGGTLKGAELTDELLGHHGSDTIFGGAGSDIIWGDWDPANNNSRQRDALNGGAGSDFIYTSHGRNRVSGGAGDDFIWAFYGRGTIDCGAGKDTVRLSGRRSAYRLRSCERRGTF